MVPVSASHSPVPPGEIPLCDVLPESLAKVWESVFPTVEAATSTITEYKLVEIARRTYALCRPDRHGGRITSMSHLRWPTPSIAWQPLLDMLSGRGFDWTQHMLQPGDIVGKPGVRLRGAREGDRLLNAVLRPRTAVLFANVDIISLEQVSNLIEVYGLVRQHLGGYILGSPSKGPSVYGTGKQAWKDLLTVLTVEKFEWQPYVLNGPLPQDEQDYYQTIALGGPAAERLMQRPKQTYRQSWNAPPKQTAAQRLAKTSAKLRFHTRLLPLESPPEMYKGRVIVTAHLNETYELRAALVSASPEPIDTYDFQAISEKGARRSASEWVRHLDPDCPDPSRWGYWIDDERRHRWIRWTPSGWLVLDAVSDTPETERQARMRFMQLLRDKPSQAHRLYRDDPAGFTAQVAGYFRMKVEMSGGEIDRELVADANLLYDLANMPSVLAEALRVTERDLRKKLARCRAIRCPKCGLISHVWDERRRGGYVEEQYIHPACGQDVVMVTVARPNNDGWSKDPSTTVRHSSLQEEYGRLGDTGQRLWRVLAVFEHDFTVDDAAAAWDLPEAQAHGWLSWFVEDDLVEQQAPNLTRYRLTPGPLKTLAQKQLGPDERTEAEHRLFSAHRQTKLDG